MKQCFVGVEFTTLNHTTVSVVRPGSSWSDLTLEDPKLTIDMVQRQKDGIVVNVRKTGGVGLFVWLEADQPGVWSNNGFFMYKNEIQVDFTPHVWTEECCEVSVTSLFDYYKTGDNMTF